MSKHISAQDNVDAANKRKRLTISHIMLLAVLLTYFVGLGLGVYLVTLIMEIYPEYAVQAFLGLLSYIGVPVGTAIAFYSWKAKNENVAKINQNHGGGQDGLETDFDA